MHLNPTKLYQTKVSINTNIQLDKISGIELRHSDTSKTKSLTKTKNVSFVAISYRT